MQHDTLFECVKMVEKSAERTDKVNQRLMCVIIVMSICFAVSAMVISGFYFFSSYQYQTVEQSVTKDGAVQNINKGGNDNAK